MLRRHGIKSQVILVFEWIGIQTGNENSLFFKGIHNI
jgi:hypothetical protein